MTTQDFSILKSHVQSENGHILQAPKRPFVHKAADTSSQSLISAQIPARTG